MNRRQNLYGTAAVIMPVLSSRCDRDRPAVSIDDSYPMGRFGKT